MLLGIFALCVVCGRSKPTEKKSRVLRPPQYDGDPNYDHEAFLGPDEAKTFEQLAPEESRRRLGSVLHLHHNIMLVIEDQCNIRNSFNRKFRFALMVLTCNGIRVSLNRSETDTVPTFTVH